MKPVSECICAVIDHGYYVSTAERLAREFKHVYYSSPSDSEFQSAANCVYGDGLETIERTENFLDPALFDEIDVFIFPEIGFAPLQKHLRNLGKPVWGSFDTTYLEMYRTQFLDFVRDVGLPVAPSTKLKGVSALREHLAPTKDQWVKLDRVRGDCETWHWIDWEHSQYKLLELELKFGGVKELIGFVVQQPIEAIAEIGYDGWFISGDGNGFPGSSFYGYEGKNEIYLGALRKYGQLPKELRDVNEAIAPKLKELGYRNFMSTEIRVKSKTEAFFIDPTFRQAGQTCEQLQETCENLGDVIWHGANGQMLEPKWKYKFAASATIHYDISDSDQWKVLRVPKEVASMVKLAHYCGDAHEPGLYHFPPSPSDELGVVLGVGNSIAETFARLKKTIDALKGEPVSFCLDGFFDLLDDIREAEKKGMKFSDDPIPTKEAILKFTL